MLLAAILGASSSARADVPTDIGAPDEHATGGSLGESSTRGVLTALRAPPAATAKRGPRLHGTHAREADFPRLKVVLKGALYRSGSPTEAGLALLCREGWKRVYSIYGSRTTAHGPRNQAMMARGKDERVCDGSDGRQRVLEWRSGTASRNHSIPLILRDVRESIRDPSQGPVLAHCWNGLHYAGMVSAMALRQFCGATAEEAVDYWRANANRGARYPRILEHIRAFRPEASLQLSAAERARVCPTLASLITARR